MRHALSCSDILAISLSMLGLQMNARCSRLRAMGLLRPQTFRRLMKSCPFLRHLKTIICAVERRTPSRLLISGHEQYTLESSRKDPWRIRTICFCNAILVSLLVGCRSSSLRCLRWGSWMIIYFWRYSRTPNGSRADRRLLYGRRPSPKPASTLNRFLPLYSITAI